MQKYIFAANKTIANYIMFKIESGNIKNIIFDLGGVLLNIDYNLTVKAFNDLGIKDFDQIFSQAKQDLLFDNYECGKINSEEFIKEITKRCNNSIDSESIKSAWNALLLDLPIERLQLLEDLKKRFRIFLLSNTNDIHRVAYSNYFEKTFGFSDLSLYFEKQYLSFEIGMRKPNKEIFNFVLSENNLIPSETVFIDDSIQHVQGASEVGIKAILLDKDKTILDLF